MRWILSGLLPVGTLELTQSSYFLIFSHGFYRSNAHRAEAFWDELRRVREAPDYQAREQNYIQQH